MRRVLFCLLLIVCAFGFYSVDGQVDKTSSDCANRIDRLILSARLKLGCKYEWGASGPQKYDCSGFVKYAFEQVGIVLSRTTSTQCEEGERVFLTNIKKGDIVFFMSRKESEIRISHVGIALSDYENGDFMFIHASSAKKCVCVSKYSDSNFRNTYGGARRLIPCE